MDDFEFLNKKYSILNDISNVITVSDNISVISNLILDLAINYTDAEKGSLMLLDDKGELYIHAARGIDVELHRNYRTKIGEGIAGIVAANSKPVLVEDIDRDARFKNEQRDLCKTKSFISCPIISKNGLLGVLNTNDKRDHSPFTEDELILIKIIAKQAAIAIENVFLVQQLKVKAAEQEELSRKLIEADVMKTEFLTRVSHELRTPINSIKGSMYYLQQSESLAISEQKEFYGIISDETDKLASIIENQLDFLRIENETRFIHKTIINFKDVLNDIKNSIFIRDLLARKNIYLHISVNEKMTDVVGDKIKILQLFTNMIEGLIFFMHEGDVLHINVNEDDFIKVVLDIPISLSEKVSSCFSNANHLFNADESEEKLKLYLAKKIIEVHGWVLNTYNKDNSFCISFTVPKNKRQKIEAAVSTSMDHFLEFVSSLLDLDVCSILLSDEMTGDLTIKSARGLSDDIIKLTRIRPGDQISGWVAMEGKPLLISDIETDVQFGRKNIPHYNTKSLISLPLKRQNKTIGVLNLNNKKSAVPFTARDLQLATVLGERLSTFIDKFYDADVREDEFKQLMTSFDTLIHAEKKYHKKSSLFPDLMLRIMEKLGAQENDKRLAMYISLIYDLGLMMIDENLLKKKGLLQSEISTLKTHPFATVGLLNTFESSECVKSAIIHHHENYDGTGYPDRLKAEEIPIISRALAVVDAFCSMIAPRPYRMALTRIEALQEIKKNAGSLYDPRIVLALEELFQELPE
jgi:HD-GYP domain-containing protein (c-di-GMP phosphodiesterase class II)/nitrogen-specific signal transduction histidine kinase